MDATCARASFNRPLEISGRPQQPGRTTLTPQPARSRISSARDANFGIVMVGEGVVEKRDGFRGG